MSTELIPLEITAYALPIDGGTIERVSQRDGGFKWAIRLHGDCMTVDGEWVYEPRPSERDDDFMKKCRFENAGAAYAVWLNVNSSPNPAEHSD